MQKSLIEFNDVLLAQMERQVWVQGMRLSFAESSMGQVRQVIWYLNLNQMEIFR